MKIKGKKKYLIAGSMFAAGLVIFLIGFSIVGFNISRISTVSPYEEKEFTESKEVSHIQVDVENLAIEFASTKENELHIQYFENKEITYLIENTGGNLQIKQQDHSKWYNQFFVIDWDMRNKTMVISIPENFEGNIDIKTSNASVELSEINIEKLIARSSNGKININNLSVRDDLDIKTSNSSINLENVQITGDAQIRTGNGAITLKDIDIKGESICSTSNASINLMNLSAKDLNLQTDNGKIDLKNTTVRKGILADTSNNSILLDDVDVGETIICTTSNGGIKGTIIGAMEDFSITSQTSNGNNNLPTDTNKGEKTARFKTSNSSIQVNFTK